MSVIYLIRHGQASFGTDNYDQLSALGREQSAILGSYFAARTNLRPEGLSYRNKVFSPLR